MPLRLSSSSAPLDLLNPNKVLFYLSFLDAVDHFPCLYFNVSVLHNAIRRYEKIWLPLLLSASSSERAHLVPPLDVEWVWVCHMLSPRQYNLDMESILFKHATKPSKLSSSSSTPSLGVHFYSDAEHRKDGLVKSEKAWRDAYPDEPFDVTKKLALLPLTDDRRSNAYEASSLGITLESSVISIAQRGLDFHYQVCVLPHFRDKEVIKTAISKYTSYVKLLYKYPDRRVSPPLDVELIWRVHMLHPDAFMADYAKRKSVVPTTLPNYKSEGWENGMRELKSLWSNVAELPVQAVQTLYRGSISLRERMVRNELRARLQNVPVMHVSESEWQTYTLEVARSGTGHGKSQIGDILRSVNDPRVTPSLSGGANAVRWVHLHDFRSAVPPRGSNGNTNGSSSAVGIGTRIVGAVNIPSNTPSAKVLTRKSFIRDPSGRRILTILAHFLRASDRERHMPLVPTAIEVFEYDASLPMSSSFDGFGGNGDEDPNISALSMSPEDNKPMPLGSAHYARTDGANRQQLEKDRERGFDATKDPLLVLRVASEDVGLLGGHFRKPFSGTPPSGAAGLGMTVGARAYMSPGLNASWDLGGKLDVAWYDMATWGALNRRTTQNPTPPGWKILPALKRRNGNNMRMMRSGYELDNGIKFDLGSGRLFLKKDIVKTGNDIVRGVLSMMSAAALYVQLQPRAAPVYDDDGYMTTMYPPWVAQQGEYTTLIAAGAERIDGNGKRMGAAEIMRRSTAAGRAGTAELMYIWRGDGEDMPVSDPEYAAFNKSSQAVASVTGGAPPSSGGRMSA